MKGFFDNQSLLATIWKWKIHFIIIGLITFVLAAIFSSPFFITPLYKSQSRVYPINSSPYSEESESEQLLEILSSADIKWKMIEKFDLPERYDIELDDPYYRTKIMKEYDDHVDYKKTEYETIDITVLDADPQVASDMVNSLIAFYNEKVQGMRKTEYGEEAVSFRDDLNKKNAEIDSVMNKMDVLRKEYGMLDYEVQAEQFTSGYMDALSGGARSDAVNEIRGMLGNLEEKGGEFLMLQMEFESLSDQSDSIRISMDEAIRSSNSSKTYAMIVEEAFPADKKSYPTRWLIVLVSLMAVEFLSLVTIVSIESFKKINN